MKWRCTWCGKPHEENDPPCDSCGHNAFEEAIVRVDEGEITEHASSEPDSVDTGADIVWACPDCGREHVRNSPPCSRCGTPMLEKTERTYEDVDRDLNTPSWFQVAKPYLPVVAGVAIVVALVATGVVSVPELPGTGAPAPPEAPGEGTEAAGIDLEETERLVHERLERDREHSRSYDDDLATYAEYYNLAYVAIKYEDAKVEAVSLDDFGLECHGTLDEEWLPSTLSLSSYDDEGALADGIVDRLQARGVDTGSEYTVEGLDIHVVDGTVHVFYGTC
ncbi:hypothetical protein [Natrinema marinum]|uniref:hypothetical protein n=1 Tax=Natrinema marinum TaxID=2961598 RepID=UPI0020C8BFE6|nr:hypothetical protein [Natrinema marinum]